MKIRLYFCNKNCWNDRRLAWSRRSCPPELAALEHATSMPEVTPEGLEKVVDPSPALQGKLGIAIIDIRGAFLLVEEKQATGMRDEPVTPDLLSLKEVLHRLVVPTTGREHLLTRVGLGHTRDEIIHQPHQSFLLTHVPSQRPSWTRQSATTSIPQKPFPVNKKSFDKNDFLLFSFLDFLNLTSSPYHHPCLPLA